MIIEQTATVITHDHPDPDTLFLGLGNQSPHPSPNLQTMCRKENRAVPLVRETKKH